MGILAEGERNKMLDAYVGRTTYTAQTAFYVQLHIAAPGAAGTSNIAANTTRVAATFGSAAATGAITNTAAVEWTSVPNYETYTDVSFWTAASNGTYLGQDTLSAPADMAPGDTFRIPIGDLDLTVT